MKNKKLGIIALAAAAGLSLAACSSEEGADTTPGDDTSAAQSSSTQTSSLEHKHDHGQKDEHGHDHEHGHEHNHKMDGGPAPAGIQEKADAKYPVGTEVTVNADHMPGMMGANGKVVGAFQTTTYAVTYTPTNGGPEVTNHKWVVQEELKDAGKEPLANGTTVTLEADHMDGMKGAEATIDSSTQEAVYMVDVEMDGMSMTNHKWVTESELAPAS